MTTIGQNQVWAGGLVPCACLVNTGPTYQQISVTLRSVVVLLVKENTLWFGDVSGSLSPEQNEITGN